VTSNAWRLLDDRRLRAQPLSPNETVPRPVHPCWGTSEPGRGA